MEAIKYTEEQLSEFAQGVFKDNPKESVMYANAEGDFRTQAQMDELQEAKLTAQVASFEYKFENGVASQAAAASAEELNAALKEIERLNELKSVKGAQAALKEKDEHIAQLEARILELETPPQP